MREAVPAEGGGATVAAETVVGVDEAGTAVCVSVGVAVGGSGVKEGITLSIVPEG